MIYHNLKRRSSTFVEGGIVHTLSNKRRLVKTNLCVRQVGPYLVRALILEEGCP